jgi:hypothetical protein
LAQEPTPTWPPIYIGATDGRKEAVADALHQPLDPNTELRLGSEDDLESYQNYSHTIRQACRAGIEGPLFTRLVNRLSSSQPTRPYAAYLQSSASTGTARWLLSSIGLKAHGQFFSHKHFVVCLKNRCLGEKWPATSHGPRKCRCAGPRGILPANLSLAPYHEQSCHWASSIRTRRHHSIVKELQKLIQDCLSVTVDIEVTYRLDHVHDRWIRPPPHITPSMGPGSVGTMLRADLAYLHKGVTFIVEVGIVDPTTLTSLEQHKSDRTPDALAKYEEQTKTAKYEHAFGDDVAAGRVAIKPFIVESTGRFGPAAQDFLNVLSQAHEDDEDVAAYLLRRISRFSEMASLILARTTAWMVAEVDQHLL